MDHPDLAGVPRTPTALRRPQRRPLRQDLAGTPGVVNGFRPSPLTADLLTPHEARPTSLAAGTRAADR